MLECSSRFLSPFREESGDEELSMLPRHTKVIVTGNNRTKSVLVGLQGVVKRAVGLGGWHWLDYILRTLIGAGEQLDGVYVFKGVAPVRAYKTDGIGSCDLWHRRLGHPSYQTINFLISVIIRTKPVMFV
ncbi:PREDICTED: uncharacterized protein LOC104586233 [Nelumbo nucifera]|uniref:Uncharacterized protein LOC104586233 n=1 Tax=Nelumbo nucifera TaxID=4432 RepID=A0A1U7Z4K3_NELNU|nr:PREDICTED: uncharacterized protein LOC104586233 [Nelumbo nucifera]